MIMPEGRDVTAVIPSIPTRRRQLRRAVDSVMAQTESVGGIAIALDHLHEGAGPTRNRGMEMVETPWLAFLDDDDEWMPHHISYCCQIARETGADVVIPWFEVKGGSDPFPDNRWVPEATADAMPSFGITCLVRREVIGDVRFAPPTEGTGFANEDRPFWLTLAQAGARMVKTPEITWIWHHWGVGQPGMPGNTSGRGDRW